MKNVVTAWKIADTFLNLYPECNAEEMFYIIQRLFLFPYDGQNVCIGDTTETIRQKTERFQQMRNISDYLSSIRSPHMARALHHFLRCFVMLPNPNSTNCWPSAALHMSEGHREMNRIDLEESRKGQVDIGP